MSGRTPAILAAVAGAALLAAVAALLLHGDPPSEGPGSGNTPVDGVPPRPQGSDPGGATPVPGHPANPGDPKSVPPVEEDRLLTAERTVVPAAWKPWARLQFLDAATKKPIPFGDGRIALVLKRSTGRLLCPEPWRRAPDGRVEVFRTEDDREIPAGPERIDLENASVEIRIPGRAPRRFAGRAELSGDREVELEAAVPSVRGDIRLDPAVAGMSIRTELEMVNVAIDPLETAERPSGGARGPGPFVFFDVPVGSWRLVVRVRSGDGEWIGASRAFLKTADPSDLGEIVVRPASTLRARVVAKDGTGVLDKDLALLDVGRGTKETRDDIDDGGWVVFRGLEPDAEFRVLSTLDHLEATVRTPTEGGGDLRVELPWENLGVRCRIRFTVEGQDPIQWGDIFEGPTLDKGAWKKDGFLEHDMAAGEYFFGIIVRPIGHDQPVRVTAKFTVPEGHLWEATVDLKEPK